MKTIEELRTLSIAVLNQELLALRKEQLMMRTQRAYANFAKTHLFGVVRKTIAHVKMVISEKERSEHGK